MAKLYRCHLVTMNKEVNLPSADLHDNSPFHTMQPQKWRRCGTNFHISLTLTIIFALEAYRYHGVFNRDWGEAKQRNLDNTGGFSRVSNCLIFG